RSSAAPRHRRARLQRGVLVEARSVALSPRDFRWRTLAEFLVGRAHDPATRPDSDVRVHLGRVGLPDSLVSCMLRGLWGSLLRPALDNEPRPRGRPWRDP